MKFEKWTSIGCAVLGLYGLATGQFPVVVVASVMWLLSGRLEYLSRKRERDSA